MDDQSKSSLQYKRRNTHPVHIGGVAMGSDYPIRVQTMTNTPTSDIEATARQIIAIEKAGAEYARVTVPTRKEAEGLKNLVFRLGKEHCTIPLVADIHFNPKLAMISAAIVNKVRINPGNFVDRKVGDVDYSEDQYMQELKRLREQFQKLLRICRRHGTALRIGTNHGSLSDRIVSRYGDTPVGMAESAMEFLRICTAENFLDVVVSMKSSNTRVMVYATRILVAKMQEEGMDFPLHLGVTEAGEGEDGRIKSAVGIGTLLVDGIGDTIRVSLTEDPEAEIPVAKSLVNYITSREEHKAIPGFGTLPLDPYAYKHRTSQAVGVVGGTHVPVVIKEITGEVGVDALSEIGWIFTADNIWSFKDLAPDALVVDTWPDNILLPEERKVWQRSGTATNLFTSWEAYEQSDKTDMEVLLELQASDFGLENITALKGENVILALESDNANAQADLRAAVYRLMNAGCKLPVIFKQRSMATNKEDFQLWTAAEIGGLFLDGLGDGLWLEAKSDIAGATCVETAFGILQASRVRFSKTEYISCPSCGRTLFDLQATIHKIQERTSHLKGLKIGIMGCIVNGPGEMADADYGYVGTGAGKVTLYKEKEVVKRNVAEENAVEELIGLIKENGDWVEP